ncbi:scaffolding protein [Bacillus phage SRT01hs]|uniref:Scaffolding protein n=1 Tax=Bacillus phage SRT01hs TaxID=2847044 RepID=A0A6B9SYA4_9CAUD|nr:head scaffolding protein [Bacillus phage SRT01hs]QHJ75887.1 scaffolding protein [Bacillus phage SRT01hs]
MTLNLEEFNEYLATIGNPEALEEQKTEALLKVQESVTAFHSQHNELQEQLAETQKKKEDLQQANNMLFVKYTQHTLPPKPEPSPEEEKKTFSEKVTVSQLVGNNLPIG